MEQHSQRVRRVQGSLWAVRGRVTRRSTGPRTVLALVGAVAVVCGALGLFAGQGAAAAPTPTGDDAAYVVLAAGPTGTGEDVTADTTGVLGGVADLASTSNAAHLALAPLFGLLALAGAAVVRRRSGLSYGAPRRTTPSPGRL